MYNQITNNMREIKFRAWDGKLMLYSPPVSTYDCCVNDEFYFAESGQSGKTFMQYTGLKDKNGKEIYEGDVLYYERIKAKCEVVFGAYPTMNDDYGIEEKSPKFCGLWSDKSGYSEIKTEEYEVIGNIYENPELLK